MDGITITDAQRKKLQKMEERGFKLQRMGDEKQEILDSLLQGVSDRAIAKDLGRDSKTINKLRCDCVRTNALERSAPHAP